MTLSTTTSRVSFSGNGVTTVFSFPYYFINASDLVVISKDNTTGTETTKILTTDYTVSGAGVASGGSVTMNVAPASGTTLTIYRDPPKTQTLNLVENDSAPAESEEQAWDKLTMIAQRFSDLLSRSMRLSEGFAGTFDPTLPIDFSKALAACPVTKADGTGWDLAANWPSGSSIAAASTNATNAAASATAAASSATAAASSATSAAASAASAFYQWGGSAGGTANALTLTPSPALSAYSTGIRFAFLATATNTGAATVAVSGLAAKTIVDRSGSALTAGAIVNGTIYSVSYDGTNFRLMGTNFANQAARTFYQGPNSGASALPTFAALVAPTRTILTSTGTTTGYLFTITSGNATVGATYTNNSNTYTVLNTISAGTLLFCSGALAPTASGTLTKSGGTGDATLTFSAAAALATYTPPTNPAPLYIKIRMVGGGGQASGSGGGGGSSGANGSATYFGPNLLIANGGGGGTFQSSGGTGGTASLGSAVGIALQGGSGNSAGDMQTTSQGTTNMGTTGAASPFGGAGGGTNAATAGTNAVANTGSGGGGPGPGNSGGAWSGASGGAGGYVDAVITSLAASYPYIIGNGGSGAGAGGATGTTGGNGGSGVIIVEEYYQ